jgi:hypothetical protein
MLNDIRLLKISSRARRVRQSRFEESALDLKAKRIEIFSTFVMLLSIAAEARFKAS